MSHPDDEDVASRPWSEACSLKPAWAFADPWRHGNGVIDALDKRLAPGSRILDLGAGTGTWHGELAERGHRIVAADRDPVAQAMPSTLDGSVTPVALGDVPRGPFALVACIETLGWSAAFATVRLLRRLGGLLEPGGLLLLGHRDLRPALELPRGLVRTPLGMFDLAAHAFEPAEGRVRTRLEVDGSPGEVRLSHVVWLRTNAELAVLARRAGLDVCERIGDDQLAILVARPRGPVQRSLAVAAYHGSEPRELDLRWSPDEGELLQPTPRDIWSDVFSDDPVSLATRYAIDDPYGGGRAAGLLGAQIGREIKGDALAFGAGITTLVRQLAALADLGPVRVGATGHPDLGVWAAAAGCEVSYAARPTDLPPAVRARPPALLHFERPALDGNVLDLPAVERLCLESADHGTVVMVDEAYASYLPWPASALTLLGRVPNLVVLRSFSKAYCAGGLRVAFAASSAPLAARVRELVPPLGVSELAYRMAMALLEAGDVAAPLRARTRRVKPGVLAVLRARGIAPEAGHPELPWLLVDAVDGERLLCDAGIAGKPVRACGRPAQQPERLRLAVPLSDRRERTFYELCARRPRMAAPAPRPGAGS